MVYNLGRAGAGIQECPHCRFTMQSLASRVNSPQNAGYMADDGTGDGTGIAYLMFGWLGAALKALYHYILEPVVSKLFGDMKEKKLKRILRENPHSLICPNCQFIFKRK